MEASAESRSGDGLIKVKEVARVFRVSRTTVVRLIREGKLQAIRVGRSYRIDPRDLGEFLETERT